MGRIKDVAEEVAGSKTAATLAAAGTGLGHVVGALVSPRDRRIFKGLAAGGRAFYASANRVIRLLFLQFMGVIFLIIAVGTGSRAWHEYQNYLATHGSPARYYLATFFFVLFTYFGVSSFWRARK